MYLKIFMFTVIIIMLNFSLTLADPAEEAEKLVHEGNELYNLGQYEEAMKYYDKAIEIYPEEHYAWNNKGLIFHNMGNYESI